MRAWHSHLRPGRTCGAISGGGLSENHFIRTHAAEAVSRARRISSASTPQRQSQERGERAVRWGAGGARHRFWLVHSFIHLFIHSLDICSFTREEQVS